MSIDRTTGNAQPRQVILWRSRSNGTVKVSSSGHLAADYTAESLDTSENAEIDTFRNPPIGGLILGRSLPLEADPLLTEATPVLETCPYCFQILPQGDSVPAGNRNRSSTRTWSAEDIQQQMDSTDRGMRDWDESRMLAVDPLRRRKPTQMLLTRPYFRMLEQSITDAAHEGSAGVASVDSTRQPSRRSSIDIQDPGPGIDDEASLDTGMEGYYKRCARLKRETGKC